MNPERNRPVKSVLAALERRREERGASIEDQCEFDTQLWIDVDELLVAQPDRTPCGCPGSTCGCPGSIRV